jgi:hypothetical protein
VESALTAVEGSWGLAVLERHTGQIVVAARDCPAADPGPDTRAGLGARFRQTSQPGQISDGGVIR